MYVTYHDSGSLNADALAAVLLRGSHHGYVRRQLMQRRLHALVVVSKRLSANSNGGMVYHVYALWSGDCTAHPVRNPFYARK